MPPPVAVVELLGGHFLPDIPRILVEDGEKRFRGEAGHLCLQWRHIAHGVRSWEIEVGRDHWLGVALNEWRAECWVQRRVAATLAMFEFWVKRFLLWAAEIKAEDCEILAHSQRRVVWAL